MTDSISWDTLIEEAGDAVQETYSALPAGDYDLQVVEVEAVMTKKAPPRPMYKIKSKVMGGAYNGRIIWDNIVLTTDNTQALGFFFRKMAALGLSKDYFKANPSSAHICATLKGRNYRVKLGQRIYEGELQNEVKTYYPGTADATVAPGLAAPPAAPAPPPPPPAPAAAAAPVPPPAAPVAAPPAPPAPPADMPF